MEIPLGDRITPDETCEKCDRKLIVLEEPGDDEDTIYLGCPNKEDEMDGHIEHRGHPRKTLQSWGWEI